MFIVGTFFYNKHKNFTLNINKCTLFLRGIALAEEIDDPMLYQECATILEDMKVIVSMKCPSEIV